MGSFEQWSDLVRQSLVWAGELDPAAGRKAVAAHADPELAAWGELLHAWETCYSDATTKRTLQQVVGQDIPLYTRVDKHGRPSPDSVQWHALRAALGTFDPRGYEKVLNTRVLGKTFSKYQGRLVDSMRMVPDGDLRKAVYWRLERLGSPGSRDATPPDADADVPYLTQVRV